jgi:hypothetical protein
MKYKKPIKAIATGEIARVTITQDGFWVAPMAIIEGTEISPQIHKTGLRALFTETRSIEL